MSNVSIRPLAIFVALLCATAAQAQLNRTAVSANGFDTAACTVTDPCRSIGMALSKTNSGGELVVLTSGGYGPFAISKSVSIIAANGVHAALTTTSGTGIDINALGTDKIILKNLYLSGLGGTLGINFASGRSLFMDSVVVDNFAGIGMWMHAPVSFVSITDCTVSRTTNTGIFLDSNDAKASINRSRVEETGDHGIDVRGFFMATIKETVVTHVTNGGLVVNGGAQVTFEDSVSSFNTNGICTHCYFEGFTGGVVRVSNSTITYNQTGLRQAAPGVLETRSNNTVVGNGADTAGSITGFAAR